MNSSIYGNRFGYVSISYIIIENGIIRKYYLIHGGIVNNGVSNEVWIYEVAWAP